MRFIAPFLLAPLIVVPLLAFYRKTRLASRPHSQEDTFRESIQEIGKETRTPADRIFFALIIVAMTAVSSQFIHRTHSYLGTAPMATDDDAISNVAINLWKNHKFGFQALPSAITYGVNSESILKKKHLDSTYHYFNYGWFYFASAGFLNWVMGDDSVEFFRMLNPWGLIFIIGLGSWFFGGTSLLPGILLGAGILGRFLMTVSPVMARPDIAVSVAASLFFVSAYFAFVRATFLWWFITGFWAATAATSHLVAWSVVLAACLTWGIFAWVQRDSKKIMGRSFLGLACGGLFGALVFLVMMGFRVTDLLALISNFTTHARKETFSGNLLQIFRISWTSSGFTFVLGWTGQLAGLALMAGALKMAKTEKIRIFALLAAPSLTTILYILSCGIYSSVLQPGYGMFSYVGTMWTMAASIAAIFYLLSNVLNKNSFRITSKVANSSALALALFGFSAMAQYSPPLEKLGHGWVKYSEYERQVLDGLPQQAYAWGNINFGFTSGIRTNLIDSHSALALALHYNQEGWKKIAPDYLALSCFTLETYLWRGPMSGKDSPLALFRRKLPSDIRFDLIRIVHAPPYGNTFIYKKRIVGNQVPPLTVAVNDGADPRWHTSTGQEFKPQVIPVTPVTFVGDLLETRAHASVRLELKKGFYLIRASVPQTNPEQTGAIVASPGPYFFVAGDVRLQHLPLFRGQTEGTFIVDHFGGPLYLSYFPGRSGTVNPVGVVGHGGFEVLGVTQILESPDTSPDKALDLPNFTQWKLTSGFQSKTATDGTFSIDEISQGNAKVNDHGPAPILKSPVIPLKSHHAYTLVLPSEMNSGGIRIGVSSKEGESLIYGDTRPQPLRVGFSTGKTDGVVVQLYGAKAEKNQILSFKLGRGLLIPHRSDIDPIDQLLSCPIKDKWIDGSEKFCVQVDDNELNQLIDDLKPLPGAK